MATELAVRARPSTRELVVLWQDPESRALVPVGTLTAAIDPDPVYRFRYRADAIARDGFEPLLAFPDLHREYTSEGVLFPFFANRVMSPRRPDYPQYVRALGLSDQGHDPIEILARSGGQRATDTLQVVEMPRERADGIVGCLFLASGVRYQDGASEHIEQLAPGTRLELVDDPDNEWSPKAVLVTDQGVPLGYVPHYLVDEIHGHRDRGLDVVVTVEVANSPKAPAHLRLLCRLELGSSTAIR